MPNYAKKSHAFEPSLDSEPTEVELGRIQNFYLFLSVLEPLDPSKRLHIVLLIFNEKPNERMLEQFDCSPPIGRVLLQAVTDKVRTLN